IFVPDTRAVCSPDPEDVFTWIEIRVRGLPFQARLMPLFIVWLQTIGILVFCRVAEVQCRKTETQIVLPVGQGDLLGCGNSFFERPTGVGENQLVEDPEFG